MIRHLQPSDRVEWIRMRCALWPDSDEGEVDRLFRGPFEVEVWVADRGDGRLCGFAEIGIRQQAEGCESSPVVYLEGIWVDPDLRRTGIASELIREVEAWALSRGYTEFASDCEITNDTSLAFHRAAGFVEVDRIICLKRPLTPDPP